MPKVWNKRDPETPHDAVYIGRGSIYGNPFQITGYRNRDNVCDLYEEMVEGNPKLKADFIRDLCGKHLVCFCAPLRCHGDYLLRIANPLKI
jgi:hypothetical protein